MAIGIMRITPKYAQQLLDANTVNRRLNPNAVAQYERDISANRWQINGAPIVISSSGRLLDGQHRLAACISAGVPFSTFVFSGAPESVMDTIDSGRARSVSDRMHMDGVSYPNKVAAIINIAHALALGSLDYRCTSQEANDFLARNPSIVQSAGLSHTSMPPKLSTIAPTLHFIGHRIGCGTASDEFIGIMQNGIAPYESPARALRERMYKDAAARKMISRPMTIRIAVNAFTMFLDDKKATKLRIPDKVSIRGWNEKSLAVDCSKGYMAAE